MTFQTLRKGPTSVLATAALTLAAAVSLATSADAALMSADWKNAGDELLTVDENGLKWLDFTETAGMSVTSVLGQLDAGGMFAGFRFATRTEISGAGGLWQSGGHDGDYSTYWTTSNNGVIADITAFTGAPATVPGYQGEIGIRAVHANDGIGTPNTASVAIDYGDKFAPWTTADFFIVNNNGVNPAVGEAGIAMALVRIDPVPLPAGAILLITAVGALALRRKTTG